MFRSPLRCFRCQYYGNVAAVCRREIPRCEKCAGGHGTKECVILVEKVRCFNCGGGYVAGDQKCPVRVRQVEVSRVRSVQKVSYAEAVRTVENGGQMVREPERIPVSSRPGSLIVPLL